MDSPSSSPLLFIAAAILLLLVLWALSVALVAWHTRRRGLGDLARWGWLLLAFVLPLVGALVYWTVVFLTRYLESVPAAPPARQRATQPMRVPQPPARLPTLQAAEVLEATQPRRTRPPEAPTQAAPPEQAFQAVVVEGPGAGAAYPLSPLPAVIGRSASASICLAEDPLVSRRHAEIYDLRGSLGIRDLGSLHGTQVNGVAVVEKALSPGDRVRVGKTVLRIEAGEAQA